MDGVAYTAAVTQLHLRDIIEKSIGGNRTRLCFGTQYPLRVKCLHSVMASSRCCRDIIAVTAKRVTTCNIIWHYMTV